MEYTEIELALVRNQKEAFTVVIDIAVTEMKDQIREAIKERWLRSDSVNGGKIGDYYSLSYKSLKLLKNPSGGGNVDLTQTGSLGDNIDIIMGATGNYEIISTDSKYLAIGAKYGFDEFGLTAGETTHFMALLEMNIINRIKNL
jgi:hypothetical protein